jgi:hypothetical protein
MTVKVSKLPKAITAELNSNAGSLPPSQLATFPTPTPIEFELQGVPKEKHPIKLVPNNDALGAVVPFNPPAAVYVPVALSKVMLLKLRSLLSEPKLVRSVVSAPVPEDPVHGFVHAAPNAGPEAATASIKTEIRNFRDYVLD